MSGLKTRFLTALVFIAVMLAGMLAGGYTYLLLFGLINFLCVREFYQLVLEQDGHSSRLRLTIALLLGAAPFLLTAMAQLDWISLNNDWILKISLLYLIGFFLALLIELGKASETALKHLGAIALGILYLGLPFGLLNLIAFRDGNYQMHVVLGLMLLTWTNDTAAYLIGSNWGRHRLFPRVSPNKTWEGTLGGIAIALVIAWPLGLIFPQFAFSTWLVLALLVGITGSLGDLVESMIKRNLTIKDSGGLLPGHGGLLDRFDAFIFSLPFVTAFLIFAGLI